MPLWALALAALTLWFCRRRSIPAPSFAALTGIYAAGIALHILLDLITSFGTMIWAPLSYTRYSWDLVFIIDLSLTAVVWLPQALAWAYRDRGTQLLRSLFLWGLCTLALFGVKELLHRNDIPLWRWATFAVGLSLAALFFLPALGGWGFRISRRAWCRVGVAAFAGYLGACALAHGAALRRVKDYALERSLAAENIGALPLPASLFRWSELIRTTDGVYFATMDLSDARPPKYGFFGDAAPNSFVDAARRLREVEAYLRFARFPVVRYAERGSQHIVEFTDLRFYTRRRRGAGFDYQVIFDASGRVISSGWAGRE